MSGARAAPGPAPHIDAATGPKHEGKVQRFVSRASLKTPLERIQLKLKKAFVADHTNQENKRLFTFAQPSRCAPFKYARSLGKGTSEPGARLHNPKKSSWRPRRPSGLYQLIVN
jgi:hypothetical protein